MDKYKNVWDTSSFSERMEFAQYLEVTRSKSTIIKLNWDQLYKVEIRQLKDIIENPLISKRIDAINIELANIEKELGKHLFPSERNAIKKVRDALFRLYEQAKKNKLIY